MSDWEKTIIPLDDAHEILAAFGIGPSSRKYERWRRDDGFRRVDFEDVLNESDAVVRVDCREWLQDAMDVIIRQLDNLGLSASADLGDEGNEGVLQIEKASARIKFVAADFDRVIDAVNGLTGSTARYRKFRSCEGSDGWSYAVLSKEDWQSLEATAGTTVQLLFN